MKRQEKYKDSPTFHYHNQNPKGRITCDCVKRAISLATGIPYQTVVTGLANLQIKTGYDEAEKRLFGRYLEDNGWIKHPRPHKEDGTRYNGAQFCKDLPGILNRRNCNVIAIIGSHHIVAIIPIHGRYKVCDTWNSTKGCIGNYWTKNEEGFHG